MNKESIQKLVTDLILFYVKENYNKYLKDNKIKKIDDDKIPSTIDTIYINRKEHLKSFIISSMKEMTEDENEYNKIDIFIKNILVDVFRDDELCKNRLILEIREYQKNI
tara:strand:+ start:205 stop:531 length:327 start_codon:yes stop_codon:yes gene_type:complete